LLFSVHSSEQHLFTDYFLWALVVHAQSKKELPQCQEVV